jgi:glycoside/pentoside/hexuronide:cation symporter, GPH family
MSEGGSKSAQPRAGPGLGVTLAYGAGSAAFGVKDQGFQYFLLLFYSQVIGLNAQLAGLALTIALALDALSDPVVGYWSDRTRSRWGRRHPFMYAAAIPTALFFVLIWNPPHDLGQWGLFAWLLVMAVMTRTAITFFETPSAALAPELTQDYDRRSALVSVRTAFGWVAGTAMSVVMFGWLFPSFVTETVTDGRFSREAYAQYSWIAGGLILAAILVCTLGTHGEIPRLRAASTSGASTLGGAFREIWEVLSNRSFAALLLTAVVAAVATGLGGTLSVYFTTFFWKLTSEEIAQLTGAIVISAMLGAALAPLVTRWMGKKMGAIVIGLLSAIGSPVIMTLRLTGVLDPDADSTFWVVFWVGQMDVVLGVCLQVLIVSMIADIAEESEVKTGRRNEGTVFAANTFIAKMVSGLGVMTAASVLALAQFPAGAGLGEVPEEALVRLGMIYIPLIVGLRLLMVAVLAGYRINRARHEENLRALRER